MREPEAAKPDPASLAVDRKRLALTILLLPLLIVAGVWLGGKFAVPASKVNPTVKLAEQFVRNQGQPRPTGTLNPDQLALERARNAPREVLDQAVRIRRQFDLGTRIFGGWLGLVIGAKLISLCLRRKRTDYEPDRGDCFACARCFEYCPNELVRRGFIPVAAEAAATPAGARGVSPVSGKPEVAA